MKVKALGGLDIITMWKEGKVIVTMSKDAHKVDISINTARWVTDEFDITIEGLGSSQEVRYNKATVIEADAEKLVTFFYCFFEESGGLVLANQRIKLTHRDA